MTVLIVFIVAALIIITIITSYNFFTVPQIVNLFKKIENEQLVSVSKIDIYMLEMINEI